MSDRRRVVLLVVDGLGIGAMADADERDRGSHTLLHVQEHAGPLQLPNLVRLGLANVAGVPGLAQANGATSGAYGVSELRHPGADTFMGHQELMGARVDGIQLRLLSSVREEVLRALAEAGHRTEDLVPGRPPILVDGRAVVADNIEALPGLGINVTGSLDASSFEELVAIGELVRSTVPVSRVIVVTGPGFGVREMREQLTERVPGQFGIDSPALGVYDENYRVRHLGLDLGASTQLPARATDAGYDVVLIGKAADVITSERAQRHNLVPTSDVLACLEGYLESSEAGVIVANVQETDLSGHEEDPARYAQVLTEVDTFLPQLLERLRPEDVLFVTGDHGNDPCVGHSQHTRERTPLLVTGSGVARRDIGVRATLADTGATMAELLSVGPLGSGTSFARDVVTTCSSR